MELYRPDTLRRCLSEFSSSCLDKLSFECLQPDSIWPSCFLWSWRFQQNFKVLQHHSFLLWGSIESTTQLNIDLTRRNLLGMWQTSEQTFLPNCCKCARSYRLELLNGKNFSAAVRSVQRSLVGINAVNHPGVREMLWISRTPVLACLPTAQLS